MNSSELLRHFNNFIVCISQPQDDMRMSRWLKRIMWVASAAAVGMGLYIGSYRSVILLLIATLMWMVDAFVTKNSIYLYLDICCITVATGVTLTLMLSGELGDLGGFMVMTAAVMSILILGIRWSSLFVIIDFLFVVILLRLPALEWLRVNYSEAYCERFPYFMACFIGIAFINEYTIQKYILAKKNYREELTRLIAEGKQEKSDVSLKVLSTMHKAMEAKIPEMKAHSEATAVYSKDLATRLGYRGRQLNLIYYAGLFHDIGKVGLPDELFSKTDISDEEYAEYKKHVDIGYEIVKKLGQPEITDAVYYHHEKMNGSGYKGLKYEEIPMVARIVAVANFIVRHRTLGDSYKDIVSMLIQTSSVIYDEDVVEVAIAMLRERIEIEKEDMIFGVISE